MSTFLIIGLFLGRIVALYNDVIAKSKNHETIGAP